MGLSFHDEKSLEEAVGSLRFASDPVGTADQDIGISNQDIGIADQERGDDAVGVEGINGIELVDRWTLAHPVENFDHNVSWMYPSPITFKNCPQVTHIDIMPEVLDSCI